MWAGACRWNSALLISDEISWSISLGSGTFFSLLGIRPLSATLKPAVRAGVRLGSVILFRGGTVSHYLVSVGADVVAPLGADVPLGVSVSIGLGASSEFSFGIDLSCIPGCSCWRSSGSSSPPVFVRSACIAASKPTPAVFAFLSSYWPCPEAATALATMSVIPLPLSKSSCWCAFRLLSFSSNHNFIRRHCASCSALCVSSIFAIIRMDWCSWASLRACC